MRDQKSLEGPAHDPWDLVLGVWYCWATYVADGSGLWRVLVDFTF